MCNLETSVRFHHPHEPTVSSPSFAFPAKEQSMAVATTSSCAPIFLPNSCPAHLRVSSQIDEQSAQTRLRQPILRSLGAPRAKLPALPQLRTSKSLFPFSRSFVHLLPYPKLILSMTVSRPRRKRNCHIYHT